MARISQFSKGVELYKEELMENLNEYCRYHQTTIDDVIRDNERFLMAAFCNAEKYNPKTSHFNNVMRFAESYSCSACTLFYNEDIVERLFPVSQRKRNANNPDLLHIQARALFQAFNRLSRELHTIYKEAI